MFAAIAFVFALLLSPALAFVPQPFPIAPTACAMSSTPSTDAASVTGAASSCPRTGNPLPNLPLPPPLLSLTPGTWAHDTMSRRLNEEILGRTRDENTEDWKRPEFAKALSRFDELRAELSDAANVPLRHLEPPSDSDGRTPEARDREYGEWIAILSPYLDEKETNGEPPDTWLSAPWLVTEFYAYRRLMEALGYYDTSNPATYLWDPFLVAKRAGLRTSVPSAEGVLEKVSTLPATEEGVALAAAFALWGNKMDLSIWPANTDGDKSGKDAFAEVLTAAEINMLHDDTDNLTKHCEMLRSKGGGNVDIIVDNAGFELVTDLALADHLVASGAAKTVTFQLKSHPTFVSDALEKDLRETVDHYASLDRTEYPHAKEAGERWQSYLADGKWVCAENDFWVQPSPMWEMPEPLRSDMATRCDLAFVKGDANYRRLLGDRSWDVHAPFGDVVGCYFPCPVCALRTLKAEIGCGMDPKQVGRARTLDPEGWMVTGQFGVVQFGEGAPGGAVASA